jgi:hypothetical protein
MAILVPVIQMRCQLQALDRIKLHLELRQFKQVYPKVADRVLVVEFKYLLVLIA